MKEVFVPPMIDCYVVSGVRSAIRAREFLDRFLPNRRELATVYEVPYMAQSPSQTFHSADMLMSYLESNPEQRYVVYWVSTDDGGVRQAIVAPTSDGGMILGLSCEESAGELQMKLCCQLKEFVGTEECVADLEMPPPASIKEFYEFAQSVPGPTKS